MVLTLDDDDISRILSIEEVLEALREAYTELASGTAVNSPRVDLVGLNRRETSAARPPEAYLLKTMSGITARYSAIRFLSENLRWTAGQGRNVRKERERPGKYSITRGSILLFDRSNGNLVAMLSEGCIRNLRVGAAAALAADYLSRSDARTVAIIGSGFMARAHLQALSLVRPLRLAKVYSPKADHRETFACEMAELTELDVEPVDEPQKALRGANIVVLATNSIEPVLQKQDLEPGVHVTCVRHCEIEENAYHSFDKIYLNSRLESRITYRFAGLSEKEKVPDIIARNYENGYPDQNSFWESLPDLIDLVGGRNPGREGGGEMICFDNSTGFGVQFTGVAGRVYELARSQGVGREISAAGLLGCD